MKISVQNIGNAEGSFYPDLSDCRMISSQSPPKYSVGVGQTQDIQIPIFTTGTNANVRQSCTVKVTDYNGGGSDSAQVSVCIKEANQCDPNKLVVQGKSICPCKNVDGSYEPASGSECTYCQYDIVVDESGKYVCGTAPPVGNGSNVIEKNTTLSGVISELVPYTVDLSKVDVQSVSAVAHNVKEVRQNYCESYARDVIELIPGVEYFSNLACKRFVGSALNTITEGLDIFTKFTGAE